VRASGPVLIAGGGIGGLAAALGLAKIGIRSVVLERAPKLGEIGAGIQLGPNAFRALDYLGVGDAVRTIAVHIECLRMMDAMTAQTIASVPLGKEFIGRFKNPYTVVHRGEMHGVLLRACQQSPMIDLRTGCELLSYERDGGGACAILAHGERVQGRALVGADGLMSRTRAQLVGDGPPRISGHSTYRTVVPTGQMPEQLRWNAMTIWVGPKCHLVHYPLSDWKVFNLVVTSHNEALKTVAGKPVSNVEVRKGFGHIHSMPLQLIDDGSDWRLWVLCDRDPVTNWREGCVTLLGDAAHPMMQYLAQGACMALEDAVCLSFELDGASGDFERAFESYRLARIARTARVQTDARRMGDLIFHCDGEAAEHRNAVMRAMTTDDYYDAMSWLYCTDWHPRGSLLQ
jgi:salicylate hydroxylase